MSPEHLGILVDSYFSKREERLALQHQVDALEKEEKALKQSIIEQIRAEKISSIGGRKMRATIQTKQKPQVSSWPALYDHIRSTGEFDLLQRRLTETAVSARWEEKIIIPGVQAFPVDDISLSKI
jgi:hypothetical protein